nr:hypothetical protein [Roseimaritima ulvae]
MGTDFVALFTGGLDAQIVVHEGTDEHRGARAIELVAAQASVFHGFVRYFQQQSLLRVDALCGDGEIAKKFRIELVDPLDESALGVANTSRLLWIRVVKSSMIPAVWRYVANGVETFKQRSPESGG